MPTSDTAAIMQRALENAVVIPAFNIPYPPVMAPVVAALRDTNCFGLIAVARPEWEKFGAISPRRIYEEYEREKDTRVSRLHLDHVPVIDEDNLRVDYMSILRDAVELGYGSVMVDGSRLPLDENITVTREVVEMAHTAGVPAEAELGAVRGHEDGPMPPYEEMFTSGAGFTDPDEAARFVRETGVDWLSVSVGSIHGAISKARRSEKKFAARLNIEHLTRIAGVTGVPLVLHGGSGIQKQYILDAVKHGIAKINVGTAIRQAYEQARDTSAEAAHKAVHDAVVDVVRNKLEIEGSAERLAIPQQAHE